MSDTKQNKNKRRVKKLDPNYRVETTPEDSELTFLHCRYVASPEYSSGWWVNIHADSFLVNPLTKSCVRLFAAFDIPYYPNKHPLKKLGDALCFTLVFPPIPKDWVVFDFIECTPDMASLKYRGIVRNNTGVYKINL